MVTLAQKLRDTGEYEESISIFRDAVGRFSETLGPDHIETAFVESELAWSLRDNGMDEDSIPLKQHAIKVFAREYGNDDGRVLTDSSALGGSLVTVGRYEEAEDVLRGLAPRLEGALGPGNEWAIRTSSYLALAQASLQKFGPAIDLQRRVVVMNEEKRGHDHERTQGARLQLAAFHHWAGEDAEARILAEAVLHTKMQLAVEDDTTSLARNLIADIDAAGTAV